MGEFVNGITGKIAEGYAGGIYEKRRKQGIN